MSLNQKINKIQFKIDHAPVLHRVAILCGLLFVIFVPWFFLIYLPKVEVEKKIHENIQTLNEQTQRLKIKYATIVALVNSHNMDKLLAQYNDLQERKRALNLQIVHFHHHYINDKDLANLLHDILKDIDTVEIKNFSTLVKNEEAAPSSVSASPALPKTPAAAPAKDSNAELSPGIAYYSLTLKGDYFAIMRFLQKIEQVKWQLFWNKLEYKVQRYPMALATIEFYTLKPGVIPSSVVTQGVAK